MSAFVLIAAAMAAVALVWVLVPLVRRAPARAGVAREASNLALLRDQLAELDADLQRGTLSDDQYREARAELERRVIEEARAAAPAAAAPRAHRGIAIAIGIALPLAAAALYLALGNPRALAPQPAGDSHEVTRDQIEGMVARLAARMQERPDDAEGWAMLARSYTVIGRYADAASAYERLVKLAPADADVLANYADTLAMSSGQRLEGKPMELVKRALAIDPNHWKALALAGSDAFVRKDYRGAAGYWERARKGLPPDSPMLASLDSSIGEAKRLGGMKAPAKAVEKSAMKSAQATSAGVSGRISVSPALAGRIAPGDTLFIFARAEGQRAPVAILRRQARELPLEFTLDDSNTMMPGMSLSSFGALTLGARISKSGNAAPQASDLEGHAQGTVRPGARGVAIVIDTARDR